MESVEGNITGSKITKLGIAVGVAAIAVGAARQGLLSDNPHDYELPVAHSQEVKNEPNPYKNKPVVNGHGITVNGDVMTINGITVDPDRNVTDQYYQIKGPRDKLLLAYANPDTHSRPIPAESLKDYGIDLFQSTLAHPVYGETYGDKNNPDNVLGFSNASSTQKAGEYWEIEGKNAQGVVVKVYLDAPSGQIASEKPVIKLSVGN